MHLVWIHWERTLESLHLISLRFHHICLFLFYLERSLFVFSWVFVTLFFFILVNHKMCQKRKTHSFLLNSDKDQNFSPFLLPFRISEAFSLVIYVNYSPNKQQLGAKQTLENPAEVMRRFVKLSHSWGRKRSEIPLKDKKCSRGIQGNLEKAIIT